MSKKLEEEKNLIKEETESKLQSESEETVRESFQPIPKDLKEDKLTEELKTVFSLRHKLNKLIIILHN